MGRSVSRNDRVDSGPILDRLSHVTRIIGLLVLAGLLQSCSAMKIFYNQSPDFAYWYLDGYLDFTQEQSLQVKDELSQLQAWHRKTQLTGYIDTLDDKQLAVIGRHIDRSRFDASLAYAEKLRRQQDALQTL